RELRRVCGHGQLIDCRRQNLPAPLLRDLRCILRGLDTCLCPLRPEEFEKSAIKTAEIQSAARRRETLEQLFLVRVVTMNRDALARAPMLRLGSRVTVEQP